MKNVHIFYTVRSPRSCHTLLSQGDPKIKKSKKPKMLILDNDITAIILDYVNTEPPSS